MLNHRNGEGVLDFADDEDTVEGADAVQFTKGADDQILIMRHAAVFRALTEKPR